MDDVEQALITRATQGDMDAFEQLVRAHEDRVYRLALKLTDDLADAMEITQDVFLTVYRKLPTLKVKAAFASWLYRIAVNVAYAKLRVRKRRMEVSLEAYLPAFTDDGQYSQDIVDWTQLPEAAMLEQEAIQHLQAAIARLPPDYRIVFVLKEMEGLSHSEIGAILELTIPAVKSRLHRARLVLRGQLATYYANCCN
jgi:RNA polymerase sigma-70 factor (ECF subfamily)